MLEELFTIKASDCLNYRVALAALAFSLTSTLGSTAQENQIELSAPLASKDELEFQVIGADPQSPSNWPATYVFLNTGGGGCTATAIGPRVVLTAAHCVEDQTIGRVNTPGGRVSIKCTHHPDYIADFTADFALCSADNDLPPPFEVVNASGVIPARKQEIFLLGYGCRTEGGDDRNFGQLFGGVAKVTRTAGANANYIRTEGGAAVCFGDSGGGAYLFDETGTRRLLIGVNSRGDISKYSFLSATSTGAFKNWAMEWLESRDLRMCGLSDGTQGCAQSF